MDAIYSIISNPTVIILVFGMMIGSFLTLSIINRQRYKQQLNNMRAEM